MQMLRILLLCFLFTGLLVNTNFAQTNTVNEFSITVQRRSTQSAEVLLRGSNFEITGNYVFTYAPRACEPCTQNQSPSFVGIFDLSSVLNAKGYINGIYYPTLYLAYGLDYSGQQNASIPRHWSKIVRVSVPATLTGRVGVWERAKDVGNMDLALFHQANVSLSGRAYLSLYWYLNSNGNARLYEDKTLTYSFSSANN